MAGGFAVIKDVPKTLVYRLARFRNRPGSGAPIPERILRRAPTAELAPHQRDQDTLPPYDELDRILEAYVEEDRSLPEILARLPAAPARAQRAGGPNGAKRGAPPAPLPPSGGAGRQAGNRLDPAAVKRVLAMVDRAEYKRRQGPPGIKITPKAFGKDRRMPITNRYRQY
jgi:NAD+ synthase (glutamine-hydrolysing)